MNVVIMGCGRVGARLARTLTEQGNDVTIIDEKASAFSRLGENYAGNALLGNGIDEDILKRAGIESADAFIAVTQGDNRNIMAAEMAQHVFKVKRVICRIYDPVRYEVYRSLGLGCICPTLVGADSIQQLLAAGSQGGS